MYDDLARAQKPSALEWLVVHALIPSVLLTLVLQWPRAHISRATPTVCTLHVLPPRRANQRASAWRPPTRRLSRPHHDASSLVPRHHAATAHRRSRGLEDAGERAWTSRFNVDSRPASDRRLLHSTLAPRGTGCAVSAGAFCGESGRRVDHVGDRLQPEPEVMRCAPRS